MHRRTLFYALGLLLALGGAASAQTAATQDRPETRAFTMTLFGGNFLGVTTETVTRETLSRYNLSGEPRGVGVTSVAADSPAAKAGLQKGDVILRFDGEPVTSVQKLQRLIQEAAPEHAVRLTVSRNGAEQELTATLARRDEFPRVEGFTLRPGEGWQALDPEAFKKFGDEWRLRGDEWRRNGEEMRKRMEEMRRQLDKLPRMDLLPDGAGELRLALGARRRIGVTTTTLTDQLADYFGVAGRAGVLVTSVSADGPAAKAGLKAGDVITEVDGAQVKDAGDLVRALNRKDDGDVTMSVTRDRKARTVTVTPEKTKATTLFGPDMLGAPPIAFARPRLDVRIPRIVVPRVRVMPRATTLRARPVLL
ncbi:MAG TPA: PDZ domain-containing protein [Pyrinomonadaceae bacterium]|jgi:serine protease Do